MLLGIGAQWLSWRLHLPSILMLLVLGFLAGPVLGLVHRTAAALVLRGTGFLGGTTVLLLLLLRRRRCFLLLFFLLSVPSRCWAPQGREC